MDIRGTVRHAIDRLLERSGLARLSSVREWVSDWSDRQFFSYAAGRRSRRDADFRGERLGPNALSEMYGDRVLAAARQIYNDNPLVSGGVETVATSVVGRGIDVEPDCGDKAVNKILRERWKRACEGVNLKGDMSHDEFQRLIVRERFVSGEIFVQENVRGEDAYGMLRVAQELIRRERLPITGPFGQQRASANGNIIKQSIELDKDGVPVAYHVQQADVSDDSLASLVNVTTRVPAAEMVHMYRRRSAGMLRGVTHLLTSTNTTRDLEAFIEAVQFQAFVAAATGTFVIGTAPPVQDGTNKAKAPNLALLGGGGGAVDESGNVVKKMRPAAITYIREKDAKVQTVGANLPGPQASQNIADLIRIMAVGMEISYESLSRDYSRSNYSSSRMGQSIERQAFQSLQKRIFTMIERRRYETWLRVNLIAGKFADVLSPQQLEAAFRDFVTFSKCKPLYPGFTSIDPLKDANATKVEIEQGLISRRQACAERGRDVETVIEELLDEEELIVKERLRRGIPVGGIGAAAPASPGSQPATDGGQDDANQDDTNEDDTNQNDSGQNGSGDAPRQLAQAPRGFRLIVRNARNTA